MIYSDLLFSRYNQHFDILFSTYILIHVINVRNHKMEFKPNKSKNRKAEVKNQQVHCVATRISCTIYIFCRQFQEKLGNLSSGKQSTTWCWCGVQLFGNVSSWEQWESSSVLRLCYLVL